MMFKPVIKGGRVQVILPKIMLFGQSTQLPGIEMVLQCMQSNYHLCLRKRLLPDRLVTLVFLKCLKKQYKEKRNKNITINK